MGRAGGRLYRAPTTSYRLLAYGEGARDVGLVAAAFALLPILPRSRWAAIRTAGRRLPDRWLRGAGRGCSLLAVADTALTIGLRAP